MKHEVFFRSHQVFRRAEFEEYLGRHGLNGERTAERILAYHRSTGRLILIRRGLYGVCEPSALAEEPCIIDPYLIAGLAVTDAVLSHDTALQFFGRAYSVRHVFHYTSVKPLPEFSFRSRRFQGTRTPSTLERKQQSGFGVQRAERHGVELRVTGLERTLVDVLDRPRLTGSWEEIWKSLENVEFFDLEAVIAYTRLLGNATTAAKVGFFLEQHRASLMVEDDHLRSLKDLCPRQPQYLDRKGRGPGRLLGEWNLVVPQELIDRSWEETE
jgi:predicted transcriptional regulator of viral defense system